MSDIQTWCVYKPRYTNYSKESSASTLITLYGIYVVGLLCFGTCLSLTVDSITRRGELLKKRKSFLFALAAFSLSRENFLSPTTRHLTLAISCFVITSERSWQQWKWAWGKVFARELENKLLHRTRQEARELCFLMNFVVKHFNVIILEIIRRQCRHDTVS